MKRIKLHEDVIVLERLFRDEMRRKYPESRDVIFRKYAHPARLYAYDLRMTSRMGYVNHWMNG